MSHIKIINNNDAKAFDSPPEFSREERKKFFYLPKWASELVENLHTPDNKIGFVLQFGYFKNTTRFFATRKFRKNNIEFIARRFNVQPDTVDLNKYTRTTFERHQELILENMGFQKFDQNAKDFLLSEAQNLCSKQIKPRLMLLSLLDLLNDKKIEVPAYHTFAEVITGALRNFENDLIDSIERNLSDLEKQLLNGLLEFGDEYQVGGKQGSKVKRY